MEIRPLTQAEQKYTYKQSMQIQGQTESIGHLRGGFWTGRNQFFYFMGGPQEPVENG